MILSPGLARAHTRKNEQNDLFISLIIVRVEFSKHRSKSPSAAGSGKTIKTMKRSISCRHFYGFSPCLCFSSWLARLSPKKKLRLRLSRKYAQNLFPFRCHYHFERQGMHSQVSNISNLMTLGSFSRGIHEKLVGIANKSSTI